jgi:hypothetical protein
MYVSAITTELNRPESAAIVLIGGVVHIDQRAQVGDLLNGEASGIIHVRRSVFV